MNKKPGFRWMTVLAAVFMSCSGCQSLDYWWNNGRRVGPNYQGPTAPIAASFSQSLGNPIPPPSDIDSEGDVESSDQTETLPWIDSTSVIDARWWRVFNDPNLDCLIEQLLCQNLTLKSAAVRVAEARAQRNIAAANLFPQSQIANGQFVHNQSSTNADGFNSFIPITTDNWSVGFDASWEVDLWGRIRRGVDAADANLCATIKDYDFAMVTLIGDLASLYINIQSLNERLELARQNVKSLKGSLEIAEKRTKAGRSSRLDVVQAQSNLALTQSLIPQLELAQRQALNTLSVLLAIPPSEIQYLTESQGRIPEIPPNVVVGIPAELLKRRPDIRAAERRLAAQFEQIGIAEAEMYPSFAISGSLGYQAAKLSDLIESGSYNGTIAPGFRWNILNYGRLRNNVRVQQARVEQLCFDFQNTVLGAQREVEDGIVEFIKNSERYVFDKRNEKANRESLDLSLAQYKEGQIDFGRVFVVQSGLVQAQDQLVATKANIALGLIATYKALGGGWDIRCGEGGSIQYVNTTFPETTTEVSPLPLPPLSTDTAPGLNLTPTPSTTETPAQPELETNNNESPRNLE